MNEFNFKEFIVKDFGSFIVVSEDHEIILIKLDDEPWPDKIIEEVIQID